MRSKKPHLSDLERARLNTICEESGLANLIRFCAAKVSHEAADTEFGVNTRIALNKLASAVENAASRFDQ